jgi:uncharacterized protein with HEPN domain
VSREYTHFIKDIKQCCEKVMRYTESMDFKDFQSNEIIYDAVIRNLEIIGEAAKNIPEHIRSSYPKVEWRKVSGLRDILIHTYFSIDNVILWDIIKMKIPELLKALDNS